MTIAAFFCLTLMLLSICYGTYNGPLDLGTIEFIL